MANVTFSTGSLVSWTVPVRVGQIRIEARGCRSGAIPRAGGRLIFADLAVTPGETLYVFAGTLGTNGGATIGNAGNAGGASDVRRGGTDLANRILVAGGAGNTGGVGQGVGGGGGAGGHAGPVGGIADEDGGWGEGWWFGGGGGGATQVAGGDGGEAQGTDQGYNGFDSRAAGQPGAAGVLGQGGGGGVTGSYSTGRGGGGGGGYYGGGGGASAGAIVTGSTDQGGGGGGGGGSSYVSPACFNVVDGGTSSSFTTGRVSFTWADPQPQMMIT